MSLLRDEHHHYCMWYRLFVPTPQINSVPESRWDEFWSIDLQTAVMTNMIIQNVFSIIAHYVANRSHATFVRGVYNLFRNDPEAPNSSGVLELEAKNTEW